MASSLSKTSTVQTLDGVGTPVFGLGVYQAKCGGETEQAVLWALKHGYRLIDTAAIYGNEEEVGSAIKKSGIPREEIYITTKLWNGDHGRENTIEAFQRSLKRLGVEYIDRYLIHSPKGGKILESWDAMVELQSKNLVRSIGVSNFSQLHLQELKKARPNSIPVVNQIELSPYLQVADVVDYCKKEGIVVEAYSPLTQGKMLGEPVLVDIGKKYDKSAAQVLIRWSLQSGFVCIPKSVTEHRIVENGDVFDFSLSDGEMNTLNGLEAGLRVAWNPLTEPWQP